MKATIQRIPPPPTPIESVILELTAEEARVLAWISRTNISVPDCVAAFTTKVARHQVTEVLRSLEKALPEELTKLKVQP